MDFSDAIPVLVAGPFALPGRVTHGYYGRGPSPVTGRRLTTHPYSPWLPPRSWIQHRVGAWLDHYGDTPEDVFDHLPAPQPRQWAPDPYPRCRGPALCWLDGGADHTGRGGGSLSHQHFDTTHRLRSPDQTGDRGERRSSASCWMA